MMEGLSGLRSTIYQGLINGKNKDIFVYYILMNDTAPFILFQSGFRFCWTWLEEISTSGRERDAIYA